MLRPGQALGLSAFALLVIGVVMVNSAGMSVEPTSAVTFESILFSRSTIYMGLAVVAMLGVGVLPIRRLVAGVEGNQQSSKSATQQIETEATAPSSFADLLVCWFAALRSLWPLWLAVAALLATLASVYLPGIGREVNHSHRWINLHLPGLDSVQPSELAKWGLILAIAWYGCRNARRMNSFWYGLIPGLAAAGLVSAFIVLEDLGTGALVGMVACLMLIAAGARIIHLVLLAPLPLAGIALAIIANPYRMNRITSFLSPFEDAQGKGYHMIQSMLAVANGQFFGRGLGHGLQKFGYLPEDTTDFLFAIICEELGVFGAALVIFLYAALLLSVLTIIRREPSRFFRLVAMGIMATVGLQALINLAVVTGLGPTKGIALPLLSSGGTGWILTAASLGLVIAMDRSQDAARRVARTPMVLVEATAPVLVELPPEIPPTSEPDDARFAPAPEMAATDLAVHVVVTEAPAVTPGQTGLLFS